MLFSFNLYYSAQGTVFLARKKGGQDNEKLYAIKKIKKSRIKRAKNERQVGGIQITHNDFIITLFLFSDDIGTRSNRTTSIFGFYALRLPNKDRILFSIRYN